MNVMELYNERFKKFVKEDYKQYDAIDTTVYEYVVVDGVLYEYQEELKKFIKEMSEQNIIMNYDYTLMYDEYVCYCIATLEDNKIKMRLQEAYTNIEVQWDFEDIFGTKEKEEE